MDDNNLEDDIILCFQHWSEKYQWWIPNLNPPDLMFDGKPGTPTTHNIQWYDTDCGGIQMHISDEEIYERNFQPRKGEILYGHKNIKFERFDKLGIDQKYIFPVFIQAGDFFARQEKCGFDFVDKRIIEHVKDGKAKIVFIFPNEAHFNLGWYTNPSNIIDTMCIKEGLTKDQVYFIHGEFNSPLTTNYTYIPVDVFQTWLTYPRINPSVFNPVDDKNLFLSYIRRTHNHRLLYICELIENNLLNRGLVSCQGDAQRDSVDRVKQLCRTDLTAAAKVLDIIRPITLDVKNLSKENPANVIYYEHYDRTFMSVVLETHYNNEAIFFSEKIWKPISAGHPFMVITGMNFLRELKNRGYRTFDKWFDESYDTMPNLNDRISCVISELNRLSKLTIEELINLRKEMEEVIIHNKKLYNFEYIEKWQGNPNEPVYFEIKKIWDNF